MELILGNIVDMETDAIVTASHSDLKPSPGIRAAVFAAADSEKLAEECRRIGSCRIGQAVVTPSCGLPCRRIIHVAGPGWYSGKRSETLLFADCYRQALHKAALYRCRSVALPLMFSGAYHVPRAEALRIVLRVIRGFEAAHPDISVYLVLYTESIFRLAKKLLTEAAE